MKKFPVAIQLYSVRDDLSKDFIGTLKKIKKMGYDGVEFAGLYDHSAEEVKNLCNDIELIPVSAHVGLNIISEDVAGIVKTYNDIGCKYMVIPWTEASNLPGGNNHDNFISQINTVAEEMKKYGMMLCYHNHDFEFEKIDGKNKLDILYSETSPDVLQTQIDTCWARVGGENPSEYVKKYTGRAPTVHIKDYFGNKNKKMYELIDGGKVEESNTEEAPFEFRPVGHGVQDIESILDAAYAAGAKYVIVEQDMPSMGKTPLECAEMSIKYLKGIM